MASTVPSIKITKSFHFKGGTRLWSNRYHFNGGVPADTTHWIALMDNIVLFEKVCLNSNLTIVAGTAYAAGSEVPVASKTYSTAGTGSGYTGSPAVGEACGLIRYSTAARTSKNHPIYLYNYMHGTYHQNASASVYDLLDATQKTQYGTYAAKWLTGFTDGTITAVRASPQGAAATGQTVEEYVTHRDFPPTTSL